MWIQGDKDGSSKKKLMEAKSEIDKAFEKYSASNVLKPKNVSKRFGRSKSHDPDELDNGRKPRSAAPQSPARCHNCES